MKARPVNGNSPGEINAALVAWLSDNYGPTLIPVFLSVKQNRKAPRGLLPVQEIDLSGMNSIPPPAAGAFKEIKFLLTCIK